jgi:transposase
VQIRPVRARSRRLLGCGAESERSLRRAVLWRKTSLGSQSGKGLRATERLLSVTETARQHGVDLLDYLTRAITAHRQNASAPPLLPAT